jgi:hypothetical protein
MCSAETNFQILSTLTICGQIHAPATFTSRKIFFRVCLEIMVEGQELIPENVMNPN